MPHLRQFEIKANNIVDLNLNVGPLNYRYLQKISLKNNKIQMTEKQIYRLALKLQKFKNL